MRHSEGFYVNLTVYQVGMQNTVAALKILF